MFFAQGLRRSLCWYTLIIAAMMLQVEPAEHAENHEGDSCVMFVAVSEDIEGRSAVRVLEEGIRGHWTQGSSVTVVEGSTINLVVAASGCEAAEQRQPAHLKVNMGNGQVLSIDLPWISAEGIDCPISSLADGVFNISVHVGPPYDFATHVLVAKLTPGLTPILEVSFPPDAGYVFGRDVEPFLQLYIQDQQQALSTVGTTARAAKTLGYYVRLTVLPGRTAVQNGAEEATLLEWAPNSRKIFLGRQIRAAGDYELVAEVLDVLLRKHGRDTLIRFAVSDKDVTSMACTPGQPECVPQRPAAHAPLDTLPAIQAQILRECPDLSHEEGASSDCSGRGVAVGGGCFCFPDYIGRTCEHHVLSGTEFLPAVHPVLDPTRCHQSVARERGMERVLEKVSRLQYETACQPERLYQRRFNKTQGLGVTLRWLGLSMMEALAQNKTLLVGGRWRAFNFEGCEERGLWCYLRPITNCKVQVWDWEDIASKDFTMPEVLSIPSISTDQGQLWWTAQMMHTFMQPSLDMAARIRRLKHSMGWKDPVLGLHVRHGDSCADLARRACVHWSVYLDKAEAVASKYGMTQIFLATDDDEVVAEAKKRNGFDYISIPDSREVFASHMYIEHRMNLGVVDRKAVSDATFLDLFLLRDCSALVGTFGSHFSKVAYELSVGAKGYFPPYVSLDDAWSPLRPLAPQSSCANNQCLAPSQ